MGYDDFKIEFDKYPESIYFEMKARVLAILAYKK